MYNWLRQRYIDKITEELREAIDNDEIDENDAAAIAEHLIEDWEARYGDEMYDLKNDR